MKCLVSCVTYDPAAEVQTIKPATQACTTKSQHTQALPKFLPTMQCHVGLYFLSNSFLMKAAISFSTLYFSSAYKELDSSHQPELTEVFDLQVGQAQGCSLDWWTGICCTRYLSEGRSATRETDHLCSTINSVLLHVFRHVRIFDDGLSLRHSACARRCLLQGKAEPDVERKRSFVRASQTAWFVNLCRITVSKI